MRLGAGLALAVTCGVAWIGTALIRRYALQRSLMDVPNHRSSHTTPTPRGGGAAIVAAWLGWLVYASLDAGPLVPWSVVAAAVAVAGVGFVDDHRAVPALTRLAWHAGAAAVIVFGLDVPARLALAGPVTVAVGILLCIGFVAWWINLTNFMDGIDGLAALHVIAVCVGGGLSLLVAGDPDVSVWPALGLAAATCGFLVWNWPPARIFMGDVGSGFLGAAVAICTLQAGLAAPPLFWAWVLLSGTFTVDATVTLLRRVWRREVLFDAHRTHAYQCLVSRWGAHRPVTLLWTAVTVLWLWPWAVAVAGGHIAGPVALSLAWAPMVWLVFRLSSAPGKGHPHVA